MSKKLISTNIIAFSKHGSELGLRINNLLNDHSKDEISLEFNSNFACGSGKDKVNSHEWMDENFGRSDLLIIIGATGIAVRIIADYVVSKKSDPAVLVIDERGYNCISLLSGHLGGANHYCRLISSMIGANPVITTATDVNNCFAIDDWARENNIEIINTDKIKKIAIKSLNHEKIKIKCDNDFIKKMYFRDDEHVNYGDIFEFVDHDADVKLSVYKEKENGEELLLCPKIASVGIGCKKDICEEKVADLFYDCMNDLGLYVEAISTVFSIDIKKDEDAIIKLASNLNCEFKCFTAQELNSTKGEYTSSDFVKKITGTDSVAERSAVKGLEYLFNGDDFKLGNFEFDDENIILRKTAKDGVTISVALLVKAKQ